MNKSYEIMRYLHDHHKGEDKAILSRNLERLFELDGRSLRRKISKLREDGYRICSGPHGYYYAANQEEYWNYLCWHASITTPGDGLPFDDWPEEDSGLKDAFPFCGACCEQHSRFPGEPVFCTPLIQMIFHSCDVYGG